MINTAINNNYITVRCCLLDKGKNYNVILSYYKNGKRKQVWRSLGIEVKAGNKNIAKSTAREVAYQFEEYLNTKQEETEQPNLEITTNTGTTINVGTKEKEITTNDEENTSKDILYADYLLNTWLPLIKTTTEITTYSGYESKSKLIIEYFRKLKITLADLKRKDIKTFYTHLQVTRNIKNKTINGYHAIIHKSLEDAIDLELIEINPAHNLRKKMEHYIPSYYREKELETLFEVAHNTKSLIELHILITAYYGLRREECVGLKWNAIDFNLHTITIEHTVTHASVDGKYTIVKKDRCKNKTSYRTLPLIPHIEEVLKAEYVRQQENKLRYGNSYKNDENYILVDEEGALIRPDRVTRHFGELLKDNNLRKIELRQLRHSCATLLLANGVPLEDIQVWLGHSAITTTQQIYANNEVLNKQNSANVIANIFSKPKLITA